jgi:DNA-binding response OmpR family regulator
MRILVVEDEQKVANALKEGLEDERYEVVLAPTGEDAFFRINTEQFDIILLDLMLPGRDGLEILRTIRKRGLDTPVLLLTARGSLEDRVTGLNAGQSESADWKRPSCC